MKVIEKQLYTLWRNSFQECHNMTNKDKDFFSLLLLHSKRKEVFSFSWQEETKGGKASVYKSATTNTSKEMTTYSNYPFPDHFPNYLHNSRIMEYLRMYAQHFDLMKYIRFLVSGAGNTQHVQNLLGRVQNQAKWGAARHSHSNLEVSNTCLSGEVSRTFHPHFLREIVWWVGWKCQMLVLAHQQPHLGPQLGTCWLPSLLKKVLVGKPTIKKLFQKTPRESSYNQPYSLRPKVLEQEATRKRGQKSKFVSFPVEGAQREEALWLLFHGTVGRPGRDHREAGILRLWCNYGV